MKPTPEETAGLAAKIAESEERLQILEEEIEEIGQPAAQELKRRLDALRIEETALKRNLVEALDMDDPGAKRMANIEALLEYIQREESAVGREAEFLHQSSPTSPELAAQAGSKLVDLCRRAIRRVLGDHQPLGKSVFVNHSPQLLEKRYKPGKEDASGASPGDKT